MAAVTLTDAASGSTVRVHSGDEIVVRLPENPTTGYRWHLESINGNASAEGDSYTLGAPVQMGSGGTREFRFRAGAPGAAQLRLKRWQVWEGERSVDARFVIDITIDA